jgi:hypothetical protein
MTWREERDALIAQTVAFVESVTGKPPDFAQSVRPSETPIRAPESSAAPPQANPGTPTQPIMDAVSSLPRPGDKTSPGGDWLQPETGADEVAGVTKTARAGIPSSHISRSQKTEVDTVNPESRGSESREPEPAPPQTTKTEFASELFRKQPSTSVAVQLDWRRDMQTEIRARIASFRVHQERFNRERQEYFSTTLARLRASMPKAPRTDD